MRNELQVVVGAHCDDGSLSKGGLIAAKEAYVVTVFDADAPTEVSQLADEIHALMGLQSDQVGPVRRAEDRKAVSVLGGHSAGLNIPELIYRRKADGTWRCSTGIDIRSEITDDDAKTVKLVQDRLHTYLATLPGASKYVVHVPIAIGGHVDHRIVRKAVEEVARDLPRVELRYYEDIPYALETSGDSRSSILPSTVRGDIFTPITEQDFGLWIKAINCYRSQLKLVFGDIPDWRKRMRSVYQKDGVVIDRAWSSLALKLASAPRTKSARNSPTVGHMYFVGPDYIGGVERYMQHLHNGIVFQGGRSVFYERPDPDRLHTDWRIWSATTISQTPLLDPEYVNAMAREIGEVETKRVLTNRFARNLRQRNVSLLHVHNTHQSSMRLSNDIITSAAKRVGIPTVLTVHCVLECDETDTSYFPNEFDMVVFASQSTRDIYASRQQCQSKHAIIPGCVDVDAIQENPQGSLRFERRSPVRTISVGRSNEPNKGWDDLMPAIAGVDNALKRGFTSSANPLGMRLVMGRSATGEKELDKRVNAALLLKAHELRLQLDLLDLNYETVPRQLRLADIFVCASRDEEGGWPLAMQEAVAAGLPIVTTDLGGQRDLLEVIYGSDAASMLVPARNPLNLETKLLELARNKEMRDHFSALSTAAAPRLDIPTFFDRYWAIYSALSPELDVIVKLSRGNGALLYPQPAIEAPRFLSSGAHALNA